MVVVVLSCAYMLVKRVQLVTKAWKVSKGPGKGMGTQTVTTTTTQRGSRTGKVRANINHNSTLSRSTSSDIRARSCGSSCVN